MNWVATNIRFPEDQYMKLKIKAARQRRSVAALIREATEEIIKEEPKRKKINVKKFMKELEEIAKENSRQAGKDFDSVKALREIRNES